MKRGRIEAAFVISATDLSRAVGMESEIAPMLTLEAGGRSAAIVLIFLAGELQLVRRPTRIRGTILLRATDWK